MDNFDELSETVLARELSGTGIPLPKVYSSVDSTNTVAKAAAADGAHSWFCVAASEQSAGRGRMGRSFFSPDGSGLYFSVVLRPSIEPERVAVLTAAAAVAVCMAAEDVFGIHCSIKWVNDVYCKGKKICGILTEAVFGEGGKMQYAVVGVGINLFDPHGGFPEEISDVAGSLLSESERVDGARNKMLAAFIRIYRELYEKLARGDESIADEYRKRCFVIGREINILTLGKVIDRGTAVDVDSECRLLVRRGDGSIITLSAGEISIRVRDQKTET